MTKEDFIKLGLTTEQAEACAEASKKELAGFVSKDKLDLAEQAKATLELQAKEYDKQIKTLQKNISDTDKLNTTIKELQEANKKAKTDYQNKLNTIRINQAIDNAIAGAKAKNAKAVKALLDVDALDFDEEKGELKGLDKQLKRLQEADDSKFLFDLPEGKPKAGVRPGAGSNGGDDDTDDTDAKSLGIRFAQEYNAANAPAGDSK